MKIRTRLVIEQKIKDCKLTILIYDEK